MKIELDKSKLRTAFQREGFMPHAVDTIMHILSAGLPLRLTGGTLKLEAGSCSISFLNNDGTPATPASGPVAIRNFVVELPGFDTNNLLSVEIPKLDASSTELLSLSMMVCPFDLPSFLSLKRDDYDRGEA